MASCPKCGKSKIKKRQGRPRACPRCGVLPAGLRFDRDGTPTIQSELEPQ